MYTPFEIQETLKMFNVDKLDIRTITMGISLTDCIGATGASTAEKVYEKITGRGGKLLQTGRQIEQELGIPIINKRISVTPVSLITEPFSLSERIQVAHALDRAAKEVGVDFLGGYSALIPKGQTPGETIFLNSIPEALGSTDKLCGSVNIGSSKAGINMDGVATMGRIIKELAARTADTQALGCAKLVVFANAVEDNPFMAGAFHGLGEPDTVIHVGVSGPGVVKNAIEKMKGAPLQEVAEEIKKTAFKITRLGQLVANEAASRLQVSPGILDLSLAPTPAVGDSVARILEEMGLEHTGAPGTTAALAMLNDAVKKGGLMASSQVGGLSGAFIPVTEDEGMVEAVQKGALTLEKLEAMTCVCSVGLDMIAIPGDVTAETIAGIIADEAAIGVINNKTTAVRLLPVPGAKPGDWAEYGGLLGAAPVMDVNPFSCREFIKRGGHIPAPVHSFKN